MSLGESDWYHQPEDRARAPTCPTGELVCHPVVDLQVASGAFHGRRDAASQNLGSQHCTGSQLASTDISALEDFFCTSKSLQKGHVANKYNEARLCAPPALHQTIWLAVDVRAFAPGTGSVHSSVAWDSV